MLRELRKLASFVDSAPIQLGDATNQDLYRGTVNDDVMNVQKPDVVIFAGAYQRGVEDALGEDDRPLQPSLNPFPGGRGISTQVHALDSCGKRRENALLRNSVCF